MRSSVLGCLLGFAALVGCSGQHVVAGDEKTQAEKLQASLPGWCASICSRLSACEIDKTCDCVGDTCSCPGGVDEDCALECHEEMSRWAQGSDQCAAAGERFKSCVDDIGCDVLTEEGVCSFSEAELAACRDRGEPQGDPGSAPTGGPNYGEGGAGSDAPVPVSGGTTSYAGGANLPTDPVSCQLGYGSGGGVGSPPEYPSLICEEGYEECSDGRKYLMYCVRTSETVTSCSCLVDLQVVGGFDPGGVCPTSEQMNAGCGWKLLL